MRNASLLLNTLLALLNGGIALILLLIAPLGLAAVLTLTLLITLTTFIGGCLSDVILLRLLPAGRVNGPSSTTQRRRLRQASAPLERRRGG